MTKAIYETPVLRSHGTVEAATKGAGTGTSTDAAFPVGTPITDTTLS